ncbi:MAG: exodeoxyribonuclease V subunit gamma, partial [Burkholderiales bacterium]|nr:exodeoxyribonuclease V subunit gamma [Burkholderiales bacterium]
MSPVLNLIQSTEIEGRNGLLESFLQQLQQSIYQQVFTSIQVIVPNHAYVNYLKNIVAKRFAVYANIDFVVLPGPVLQNLFSDNNPNTQFIDFNLARFVIYDYLCKHTIDSSDALELNQYIYTNGKLDINKIFALST